MGEKKRVYIRFVCIKLIKTKLFRSVFCFFSFLSFVCVLFFKTILAGDCSLRGRGLPPSPLCCFLSKQKLIREC